VNNHENKNHQKDRGVHEQSHVFGQRICDSHGERIKRDKLTTQFQELLKDGNLMIKV
jgi:hypothetical protein